jgi:DNA-binding MarR family transcriptional regulator
VVSHRYLFGMTEAPRTPDRIAELLVHLGRAAQSEDGRSELTAAQWTCLRFFARANSSTRTPSAFASFQATTRGTASQIIKSLERRGLLTRSRSDRDRRSVCFDLSEKGRATLARDPLGELIAVIDGLDTQEREGFLATLSRLTSALAAQRRAPAFGTCRDCSHFGRSAGTAHCACMAAELAVDDIAKLCASYRPAPDTGHARPRAKETPDGAA